MRLLLKQKRFVVSRAPSDTRFYAAAFLIWVAFSRSNQESFVFTNTSLQILLRLNSRVLTNADRVRGLIRIKPTWQKLKDHKPQATIRRGTEHARIVTQVEQGSCCTFRWKQTRKAWSGHGHETSSVVLASFITLKFIQ